MAELYPPGYVPKSTDFGFLGSPSEILTLGVTQVLEANAAADALNTISAGLAPTIISPEFPTISAPALVAATAPTMDNIVWSAPGLPTAFSGTLDISAYTVAPFEDEAPELIFGSAPAAFSEVAPDAPPVDLSFDMPELTLSLPAAPDLLSISVTPFEGLNMPTVDFTLPELNVVEPSIREYVPGSGYHSSLLTALAASLEERLTGGTGLDPDVEGAIWDRGREREARSAADAIKSLDQMEAMGFAAPPGVYVDARIKIATETDYANRGHSREVMIAQAQLAQENVKHALSTAQTLEATNMTYANQVEQRAFESCCYATEAGVAIYNAKVQAYAALVDAYSKKVQIYVAQVQAETTKVEAYKAQIQAETAKAQVNSALVEQYKAQADVALSQVEIFKARIGAIQTRAEIERTKVAVFGEQVKAYTAKIGAYTAGVEGYRAQVQAEGAKQEAFRSKVAAFEATVSAASKQIEARIRAYEAQINAKTAEYDGYKAIIQAESARVQGIASVNSARADVFKAEVTAQASYNEVLTKQWQGSLDQAQRITEIGINTAKANAELYVTTRNLAMEAAKVNAQVTAQVAAAALSTVNWSNSLSKSSSYGESNSFSGSVSVSGSTSNSTNYNYSGTI